MARTLCASNKLLSLRGRILITDTSENVAYEGKGEFSFFPTWRLYESGKDIATIKRKIFAWSPTWKIESTIGPFTIKRKIWAMVRRYSIVGGKYHKAELRGNFFDHKFTISKDQNRNAHATKKLLTLRDRHSIEIKENTKEAEIFVAITMIVMLLGNREYRNNSHQTHGSHINN